MVIIVFAIICCRILEGKGGGEVSASRNKQQQGEPASSSQHHLHRCHHQFHMVLWTSFHMGLKHASREKKLSMVNFLIFVHKNVYRIRFQKIKIGPLKGFEKKAFFSLLLMRKRLSGGQKWFLKPYFPLIRGMFGLRSGLRFSFRALEVPEPRVRKRPLSPTNRHQA